MLTLAALPRLMVREGKFEEVDVKLLLDDQVIGNGMMRRGPRIGLPALVNGKCIRVLKRIGILSPNDA